MKDLDVNVDFLMPGFRCPCGSENLAITVAYDECDGPAAWLECDDCGHIVQAGDEVALRVRIIDKRWIQPIGWDEPILCDQIPARYMTLSEQKSLGLFCSDESAEADD